MSDEAGLPSASGARHNGPARFPIWLAPLMIGVGGAFVVLAFLFGRTELRYGDEGVQTQATIARLWVEETENSEGDTSTSYRVGYRFVVPGSGRAYEGRGDVGELRYLGLRIGDRIDVSYLASDPSENRLGSPEPQLFLPIAIGAFGGLAIVAAPLIFASSIRERRMRRATAAQPPAVTGDVRRIDVFTRSPAHAAGGPLAIGAGFGALLVGGFGLTQAANMPSLLALTLVGGVVGVGLIAVGISGLRRGFGLRVAEVGPDGLWIRGLGRIAWADVAEVWIEEPRSSRRADGATSSALPGSPPSDSSVVVSTSQRARLGVVPRDGALAARRPDRLALFLGGAFFSFVNVIRPSANLVTSSEASPFGISASELDQPFDDLVASCTRFLRVGTREVRTIGSTGDSPETASAPMPAKRPLTDDELSDLDGRFGTGSTRLGD